MIVWLILIAGSLATGYFFGLRSEIKGSWYYAIAVPWLVLLVAILITEYVVPYQGGGASMWLVAQFFGGSMSENTAILLDGFEKNHCTPCTPGPR